MTEDRELQRMNRDARISYYRERAAEAQALRRRWDVPEPTGTLTITINAFAAATLTRKIAELAEAQADIVGLNDKEWDGFLTIEDEERLGELEHSAETCAFEIAGLVSGYLLD